MARRYNVHYLPNNIFPYQILDRAEEKYVCGFTSNVLAMEVEERMNASANADPIETEFTPPKDDVNLNLDSRGAGQ